VLVPAIGPHSTAGAVRPSAAQALGPDRAPAFDQKIFRKIAGVKQFTARSSEVRQIPIIANGEKISGGTESNA
jgi:hypothetical protein